nr:copper homeostasis protein CutC [Arachidicoccus ginsenosidivorans]
MLLEIAVFNISAALQAQKAGADRLELCENPLEGGTTPSYGTLRLAAEKIAIPVFPIIRPRGETSFMEMKVMR